jgi:hypothetical protein
VSDPKRLLEMDRGAASPNVLLQNLLGAAQADGIPRAVRQRTLRSIESAVSAEALSKNVKAASARGAKERRTPSQLPTR